MFPSQGGFLCFDSFKPFSMSCQAQCLIETCVCFLDIFLVFEFPLLSVYFFLQTSMIAVLSHTYKKKERERKDKYHLLLKSQTYQELSLGLSGVHPVWCHFWRAGFRWVLGGLDPREGGDAGCKTWVCSSGWMQWELEGCKSLCAFVRSFVYPLCTS